ncbi:Het-C-domain-containing protein [Xylariomycetidae sp. FL0641]|nr:Het-C-domain-containing protein [Xylariomycetidae sp. FL0641]
MITFKPYPVLLGLALLLLFARPAHAFGAGNIASISKVEGQNWRHGDIEDTLLQIMMARAVGGKKFNKLMVSRTYFGNWLRDYSQAIDVGTVKSVSAEAIRLLLCVLGFMTFGFGSGEFEVTAYRLGCYRPEDHIDNPKGYGEGEDARQYDERLRGPIDEEVELAIDEESGLKNYIANERAEIMTSALHVRRLFRKCIELARRYKRDNNKDDLYEALRLLGTGLHCLEDFLAHSNYCELALIEMGERDVFPHVGSNTMMEIPGAQEPVWPCVTGTFGGVDFLHSVTGEVSDKMTQNEIQELENNLQQNANNDTSIIADLLDKIPAGVMGGDDKKQKMDDISSNAANAQMETTTISPREPEEFTRYIQQVYAQIMPAIELHDQIMKDISEAIENIPILPQIIEQLEEQMSKWVFTIMAPFVVPIIQQVKNELSTGSEEIIASSENEQHVVFHDDDSSDPTHSMLSKDHFSNILNEIAGKTASKVVSWVVPQLMEAWDDDGVEIQPLLNRIIHGVMHHPAQRERGPPGVREGRAIMFRCVEDWWNGFSDEGRDEYRDKLSREGVREGRNHKEGVHDSGHGCGKPLGMHKNFAKGGSMEDRIASQAADAIFQGVTGGIENFVQDQAGGRQGGGGGGGGLIGAIGDSLLSGFNKKSENESYRREDDGGYRETREEYGRDGDRYGQAEYSERRGPRGGEEQEYRRYEQDNEGRGYGYEERRETRPSYGGGYEERTERRYESNEDSYGGGGGGYDRREEYGGGDSYGRREEGYGGGGGYGREESYGERREERREERRDDGGGGGGFLGDIIDRVGESMDESRRRQGGGGGGGWGF